MSKVFRDRLLQLEQAGYQVMFLSHAEAIVSVDFVPSWCELSDALLGLTIPVEEIIGDYALDDTNLRDAGCRSLERA